MLSPVEREVMAQLFAAAPEEMGAVLVRSARSPNIRERRDSSAALFTAAGELVAQAAHIPVHLGAMPDAVRAVMARGPRPGEAWLLNDPYTGGTHLPDVTVIEAVGASARGAPREEPVAYAVVRAHHADVGGDRPGSMPPGARSLREEGVIIPPTLVARHGELLEDVLEPIFAAMREPAVRRADLAAQLAAAARGAERWRDLIGRYGERFLEAAAADLLDYAERRTRIALSALREGVYQAEDALEGDGVTDAPLPIRVRVTVRDGRLAADFEGTAPAAAGNVNCPISVTRSAALFVVRCLIPEDVPTNGGVGRCVEVRAPDGCLVNALAPHAVAAGNVETSQRIADVMFLALAAAGAPVPAQGQGTMNNVIFGTPRWTYYETLGGGQGGGPSGPGPSGVHVGMSNTMNTPVEVLEMELPLRVERYGLLPGSGGWGAPGRGGDGVVREIRVLEPCALSLITERRSVAPRGLNGGRDGRPGANFVNGSPVGAKAALDLEAGDVVRIETPGGGGYGGDAGERKSGRRQSADERGD
jgi:N-methylhydantoinase B